MDGLRKDKLASFPTKVGLSRRPNRCCRNFSSSEDQIDDIVRQKIASLSRQVPPGSREWDILYRKYIEEETRKQRK